MLYTGTRGVPPIGPMPLGQLKRLTGEEERLWAASCGAGHGAAPFGLAAHGPECQCGRGALVLKSEGREHQCRLKRGESCRARSPGSRATSRSPARAILVCASRARSDCHTGDTAFPKRPRHAACVSQCERCLALGARAFAGQRRSMSRPRDSLWRCESCLHCHWAAMRSSPGEQQFNPLATLAQVAQGAPRCASFIAVRRSWPCVAVPAY